MTKNALRKSAKISLLQWEKVDFAKQKTDEVWITLAKNKKERGSEKEIPRSYVCVLECALYRSE